METTETQNTKLKTSKLAVVANVLSVTAFCLVHIIKFGWLPGGQLARELLSNCLLSIPVTFILILMAIFCIKQSNGQLKGGKHVISAILFLLLNIISLFM